MKKIVAAAAAAALLVAATTPAQARWHHRHPHDGFGGFLTGALIVGGIAAIASSGSRAGSSQQDYAVRACTSEAESRTGGRLLDVGRISKRDGYFTVEGLLENGREAPRESFACTVRDGTIYSFRSAPAAD
ncbi:MAG: hypothetical protein JO013_08980 [Alphaproteobacteria bacterium]|nr:hypothetical protein [Alphaproteobacteria bacterium]